MLKRSATKNPSRTSLSPGYYIAQAYRSSAPERVLAQAKKELAPECFTNLMAWLAKQPSLRAGMFGPLAARSINELYHASSGHATSLRRELQWAAAYLQEHSDTIIEFLHAKQQFHRFLLSNDFKSATSVLDKIEARHGMSMWLVCSRIHLLQAEGGMERQKAYLKSLLDNSGGAAGIATFVAYYTSVRNEPVVTAGRFIRQFNRVLTELHAPDWLLSYLRFHILHELDLSSEQMADVLSVESTSVLVDYYETTVHLTALAWARDKSYAPAVRAVAAVCGDYFDARLLAAVAEVGGPTFQSRSTKHTTPGFETITPYESFLKGNYGLSVEQALDALSAMPDRFELMLVAARAMANLDKRPPLESEAYPLYKVVTFRMAAVLARAPEASEHFSELLKVALNNHGEPWAHSLFVFCNEAMSDAPISPDGATERFVASSRASLHPMYLFDVNDQRLHTLYSEAARRLLPASVALQYGCHEPVEVLRTAGVSEESLLLIEALTAYRNKDFRSAAATAQRLTRTPYRYFVCEAERLVTCALLQAGDTGAAISFATSILCRTQDTVDMLPMNGMADCIDAAIRSRLQADISLPVFVDLYSKHVDRKKLEDYRIQVLQDFLESHGVDRASCLKARCGDLDRNKLVYFLRYICIDTNIDLTGVFESSKEVAEERVCVCKILIDLDPANAEVYHSEIKGIYQNLMIQKGIRNVEQSKIYVDKESIRQTAERSIREGFNRYVVLAKDGLSNLEHVIAEVSRALTGKSDKPVVITLPKNEAVEALSSAVFELRDQYVSNSESGLDGYLSVHIRHGTLAGQLRSPLLTQRLITTKEAATGAYNENAFWAERLHTSPAQRTALVERLGKFSQAFDALVTRIVNEWVQVKKERTDPGLFDFTLSTVDVICISDSLDPSCTFDDFLNAVLGYLDTKLERSLFDVRQRFEEAKHEFSSMLTSLESDVEGIVGRDQSRDLVNAVRTTVTDLLVTIDRVSEWFRYSQACPSESYGLADVIQISAASVRVVAPEFEADAVDSTGVPIVIPGRQLSHFVNVFFIVFENIARHSAAGDKPRATVKVALPDADRIHIRVENNVGQSVARHVVESKLAKIKSEMLDGSFRHRVRSEGGTGFHKINKIFSHDLGFAADLKFGFSSKSTFYVDFSLPFKIVDAESLKED